MKTIKHILLLLTLTMTLTGCRSAHWQEYRLFCGQSIGGGTRVVSAAEWDRFCDEAVAPEFPDGFTVVNADGRWLHDGQTPLREKTKILLILAPDTPRVRESVDRIAAAYRSRFDQESVLVVRREAAVEFK